MLQKKSLGQNFLKSKSAINKIVLASELSKDDIVLEIGPGEGVLTEEILKIVKKVFVVEKDDRLIPFLKEKFAKEIAENRLEVIHDDILNLQTKNYGEGMTLTETSQVGSRERAKIQQDFMRAPSEAYRDKSFGVENYKLVANIPYYITGQIIRKFLEAKNQPKLMTLLVQKEVAERIVARDKKESLLSISVKVYGEPKIVGIVPKGSFVPSPKVDSAIISIKNISKINFSKINEDDFFEILHLGFGHKRKMLLSNLSSLIKKEKLLNIFEKLKINQKVRAEDLSLEDWLKITENKNT